MAEHHAEHDAHAYQRGTQEISEQVSTFHLFNNLTKWGSLAVAAVLLFLTVWFMPNGSFMGGAIAAVVLIVAGWWFLRDKPQAH